MPGYIQFIRGQFTEPPVPSFDLSGRTIIVTGANSGLGLEAAKLLIQLNCSTVILACRSIAKGEQAKETLGSVKSKNGQKPSIVVMELDMCSFPSIIAFSERCKDLPRIDAVLLNAGIVQKEFNVIQGYELTLLVNVVSTFFLAVLLTPILQESARKYNITPNIAITGSAVHFWAKEKDVTGPPDGKIFSTLSADKHTDMNLRYNLSKLHVMLLVKYLAQVFETLAQKDSIGKPLVVINHAAPGLCWTPFFREQGAVARQILKLVARSGEHGARTLVYGAGAGKETHGQYLSECQIKPASDFVQSAEGDRQAKRLWKELSGVYESLKPGCTAGLQV
ncbi:hypothetical protein PV10_02014 [Exophiala mesophila]|uniref:Uncharacterized protein n=1 Tax=Exophiala mesophila TaxID=212818 RepID=A0A0D1ZHX8_EXOME|nr:uncharacterized protein PV10_02014 [Exophiala mesophila]KIV94227.1 hypothetical protein PV10_02014 [Exophiala mesophila]